MADRVGERFERLVEIMRALRAPDGCPWDREQTHTSLRPFVLEETYEVLEAIESGQPAHLCEELGDFLFEAVFLARISEEAGDFTIADAIDAICNKLVRRHPHVFERQTGDPTLTSSQVIEKWETLKARERAAAGTPAKTKTTLSGVPKTLPALLRAYEVSFRAAAVGFDWVKPGDVLDKIDEEVAEVRRATDKFTARFEAMEATFAGRGKRLNETSLEEMDAEWQRAKATEPSATEDTKVTKLEPHTTLRRIPSL
jgi:MazG family protein